MERKVYGSEPSTSFGGLLPNAGDPDFETDSQNNDEFYTLDTDVPRDTDDTGQPEYGDS